MDTQHKSITEWIATTRTMQGLTGTVSLDPALHARTLGAVQRATVERDRRKAAEGIPAA